MRNIISLHKRRNRRRFALLPVRLRDGKRCWLRWYIETSCWSDNGWLVVNRLLPEEFRRYYRGEPIGSPTSRSLRQALTPPRL